MALRVTTLLLLLTWLTLTNAFIVPSSSPSSLRIPSTELNIVISGQDDGNTQVKVKKLTYGEESRVYRRTVYTSDDWVRHRDPDRFFRNLISLLDSGIVVQLFKEVSAVMLIAFFAVLWNAVAVDGFDDFDGARHESLLHLPRYLLLSLPSGPFNLTSSVLGLMLVFRTNTSYFRWNEARSCWGRIVNHTRNIMRMGSSWMLTESYEEDPLIRREALADLELAIWEFPRSLQRHLLRAQEDEEVFQMEVRERLAPKDAEALIAATHRPTKALFDLSNAVERLPISYIKRIEIDKSIVVLGDMAGACERILSSPVPLVYTRHTARILSLWLLLLPFSLWDPFKETWNHIGMIPCAAVIAFFFFGIEELAVQLEEPFSILPLASLTNSIDARAKDYNSFHDENALLRTNGVKPVLSMEPKPPL